MATRTNAQTVTHSNSLSSYRTASEGWHSVAGPSRPERISRELHSNYRDSTPYARPAKIPVVPQSFQAIKRIHPSSELTAYISETAYDVLTSRVSHALGIICFCFNLNISQKSVNRTAIPPPKNLYDCITLAKPFLAMEKVSYDAKQASELVKRIHAVDITREKNMSMQNHEKELLAEIEADKDMREVPSFSVSTIHY